MHTSFGISLIPYLLKLSASQGLWKNVSDHGKFLGSQKIFMQVSVAEEENIEQILTK